MANTNKDEDARSGTMPTHPLHEDIAELKRRQDNLVRKNLAGVFMTNVAGRFLECNDSLARMLGYGSAGELMEVPVAQLYPDQSERRRFIDELLEKKQLSNYEVLLRHKDGRTVHILENVSLNEINGRASTIEGTAIDISGIRKAEQEQRALLNNYRQLAERARDGILLVRGGVVEYTNPAAQTLLGNVPVTGRRLVEVLDGTDHDMAEILPLDLSGDEEIGPFSVRSREGGIGARHLLLFATGTRYMGEPAMQISIQDLEAEREVMQDRLRAKMAEEVNEILRAEIAEHRRTQGALRQSRRFARSLIDSSLDMIIAVDKEGKITEFNPAAAIKFGYEGEEVLGRLLGMLFADQQEYERLLEELVKHGAFAGEVRNITRTGNEFTSFLAASRLYDEDGQLLGSMGVSRDITRDKSDKEALRQSEERYRDLFENATDLIHSINGEGRFLYVNKAWTNTLGYTADDLREMSIFDIVVPEDRERVQEWLSNGSASEDLGSWRANFIGKNGSLVMMEGNSTVRAEDGRTIAVRSIFRDITAAFEAEEQLRQHAAKERALFETSEHMFWTVDRRIALTNFNQGYADMVERLHGARPEINTDASRPRSMFASPEYHRFWEAKYAEVFAGKPVRFETDLHDRDGKRVSNEIFISPVFDEKGGVVEAFGIGHEITSVKETRKLVREQAARLKAIFESSANTMIWTFGEDLALTSINGHFKAAMERHLGESLEVGDDFEERILAHADTEMRRIIMARAKDALSGKPQQVEVRLDRKDGGMLWVQCFLSPIVVEEKVSEVSCLAYDITDRKEAEHTLLENLREKEVLLREVHHRVKNNLQIIISILNLQKDHVDEDPRSLALLHEGQERIRSMSFIHESLYQSKNFSHVDLASYIDGLCRNLVMSYSLSGKVRLVTDLQEVLLDLDRAIPCGLILNELISNALKHAFPEGSGGVITVHLWEGDEGVAIRISDDGRGLPVDLGELHSSGLGMELVNMLVEQLDGHIRRESPSGGKGTSYLLTFDRS